MAEGTNYDSTDLLIDLYNMGYFPEDPNGTQSAENESLFNTIEACFDKRNFIDDDGVYDNNIGDRLDELINVVNIYKDDRTKNNKDKVDAALEYFRELSKNPERL